MDDSIMEQDSESKSYLRRAGQYQDDEIENILLDEAGPYLTIIFTFIAIIFYGWIMYFLPVLRNPFMITIIFLVPIPYYISKILKLRKQIGKHRRGSLGEKVVADELEKIKRHGYMVIHDFQHKAVGNIDHIAIGPRGVFAIETKYRSKKNKEDTIFYDGKDVYVQNSSGYKMLIDNDKGKKPCSQAVGAAIELQKMLQKDFPVVAYVQAVVVFPFWKVAMQYSNTPTVRVSDAKELYKQIQARDDNFSDETVMEIYEFLAQRNRRSIV